MDKKFVQFGFIISLAHFVSAVNILVLEEVPSPSHHLWFRTFNKGLASKGYNVTVLSPDEDSSSTNLHYIHMEQVYELLYNSNETEEEEVNFVDMGLQGAYSMISELAEFTQLFCIGQTRSGGWKQLENYPDNFKFDLVIYDYVMGGCLIAFANKFKNAPIIGVTASNDNFKVNLYSPHAIVPAITTYAYIDHDPTTFLGRTYNFIVHMADRACTQYYTIPKVTALIRASTSFTDSPSMLELGSRSILYMTNYDPSVDGIQQLPPNVIPVGGLQIKPVNKLPENLQSLADGAINGLILFSLGTNVRGEMLGTERIINILEAFRKLAKYTILWKVDLEEFPIPLPSNVVVLPWVPQNDILGHKNTKLFITHGGLLSTQESIYHGVPMLGIPIFFDQFTNIRRSVAKGFADVLYVNDISTDSMYTKINGLLTQSKYREKIGRASATFRDQKETPLERALWWVDWVLRNPKADHFRSADNLHFLQLESFDVIVFIASVLLIVVIGIVWFVKKLVNLIVGHGQAGKRKRD